MSTTAVDTARAAVLSATAVLRAAGVPSPRYDAEELLLHLLDRPRTNLWSCLEAPAPSGLEALVERRARREPLQHIVGRAYFRHVQLRVGPGVFVPRPETECVAGVAIDRLHEVLQRCPDRRPVALDLCSGSGAIALSIVDEVPEAEVHAVECDAAALRWLRRNLAGTSVIVHGQDMTVPLPQLDGDVDVLVANPPYIPVDAVAREPEVAWHDPALALYSGPDGLDALRVCAVVARRALRPGGWAIVEHADVQARDATTAFAGEQWHAVADHKDLTGRDRYVVAQRTTAP